MHLKIKQQSDYQEKPSFTIIYNWNLVMEKNYRKEANKYFSL